MLRDLRDFLRERSIVELVGAILVAIGLFQLVHALVDGFVVAPLSYLDVDLGSNRIASQRPLTFTIGHAIFYSGNVLSYALTLVVVGLLLLGALRLVRSTFRDDAPVHTCPHCLSEIPVQAAVCRECGRDTAAP